MASKNVTQVLIAGKIYRLSGYESEEYLQRVAAYLNGKITEVKTAEGYSRLSPDMKSLLLNLNTADDYFKLKKQADQLGDQITQKDRELYEIKHELISASMKLETAENALASLRDEYAEAQKRIAVLETQLKEHAEKTVPEKMEEPVKTPETEPETVPDEPVEVYVEPQQMQFDIDSLMRTVGSKKK